MKHLARKLAFLYEEIATITARIEPHDCGYLKTTVGVLKSRVKEVLEEIEKFPDK